MTDEQAMEKHGSTNLVFSSSATVYGTPETIPIPETSPIAPMSVYGRTKGMVESIIRDAAIAGAGANSSSSSSSPGAEGAGSQGLRAVSVRYFK